MMRMIAAVLLIFVIPLPLASESGIVGSTWVVPGGNEEFISASFDSEDQGRTFSTEAIGVERERIVVSVKDKKSSKNDLIYLTYLRPQSGDDDCLDFLGLWLCCESASFKDALPAAYLEWLKGKEINAARLKALFVEKESETGGLPDNTFLNKLRSYLEERGGFLLGRLCVLWLYLISGVLAFSFVAELKVVHRRRGCNFADCLSLLLISMFLLAFAATALYLTIKDFICSCQ